MTLFSSRWKAGSLAAALVFTGLFAGCDDSDGDSPDAAVNPDGAATGGTGGTPGTGGAPAQGGNDGGVDVAPGGDGGPDTAMLPAADPDVDMVFVRLNENGQLDSQFGTAGVARINLSSRFENVYDTPSSIAIDTGNRLVAFGAIRGDKRADSDRVVFRLTPQGVLDTTFAAATKNYFTLNMANANDNPKRGFVHPDGRIVFSGYSPLATSVGAQSANSIVLLRLKDDGTVDTTFGVGGVVVSNPFRNNTPNGLWGMAEAYSVGLQGTSYVTTGYGRLSPVSTSTVDIISARFTETGVLDSTFKDSSAAHPASVLDLSAGFHDRGRDLAVLPDGRVVIAGSTATSATEVDALVVVLTKDGALDPNFNTTGWKKWDLARTDDSLRNVAASADGKTAYFAGYSTGNSRSDDAIVGLVPMEGGTAPVVKNDPISDTANDRFNAVAAGTAGKFYAAGFVAESDKDTALVVVRYSADGTRDASFGTAGVVKVNVAVGKGLLEAVNALVVQPDGKIVLAAQAEGN